MQPIIYGETGDEVLLMVDSGLELADIAARMSAMGTELTARWKWQGAIPGRHTVKIRVTDKIDPSRPVAESNISGDVITYTVQPVDPDTALQALSAAFSMRTISSTDQPPTPVNPISVV